MIFYKAIKYTILDYCIEKLFNQIYKNLKNPSSNWDSIGMKLDMEDLAEGLFVSKLRIYLDSVQMWMEYPNCTIYTIRRNNYTSSYRTLWEISFTFEMNGSVVAESRTLLLREEEIEIYA